MPGDRFHLHAALCVGLGKGRFDKQCVLRVTGRGIVPIGNVFHTTGGVCFRKQIGISRQAEVIQNASFAIAYLVPDDTDDVFENGGHIGVVGDEPADIDVVAGFEVGQQF